MTTYIDVFNGDADGLFSLIQWRKAYPVSVDDRHILITGVKRDVSLANQINNAIAVDSIITVLDVSFDKNCEAVQRLLPLCTSFFYCDHHKADKLQNRSNWQEMQKLTCVINTTPTVCTGLLIYSKLKSNTFLDKMVLADCQLWALSAAYGDGLDSIADRQVAKLGLSVVQHKQLKQVGVLVNYNGYGSAIADLHFLPDKLYQRLAQYDTPFAAINDADSPIHTLQQGYETDMALANQVLESPSQHSKRTDKAINKDTDLEKSNILAVRLPDAAWARRISGTFGNQLAALNPNKPIVIATLNPAAKKDNKPTFTISLRAPRNNPYGASTLCSQFATGGGREGAAGINALSIDSFNEFLQTVQRYYNSLKNNKEFMELS